MPKLPPAYQRDAARIAEIAGNLVAAGRGNPNRISAARDLATRLRAFLTRWQNQPAVASHEGPLATFREQLLRTERHIEGLHVATLAELLEYRKCRIHAHNLLEAIHRLADLVQHTTPDEMVEVRRKLTEIGWEDFDHATAVARQTVEIARQDSDYERLVDEYERFWPDRLDDPHYLRILSLELDQHETLAEELNLMKSALADPRI